MHTTTLLSSARKLTGTLAASWLVFLERGAYYSVRSVMVVWMIRELGWPEHETFAFYGTLTLLVHMSSVPGGLLADLLIGSRWMIVIMCAVSGLFLIIAGTSDALLFKLSLAIAFIASGMTKPNFWSLIAGLYKREEDERDLSLLFLYVAINLGAVLATTVVVYLAYELGLEYGFFIGGALMLASSASAFLFKDMLPNVHSDTSRTNSLGQAFSSPHELIRLAQLILIFVILVTFWSAWELWNTSCYEWIMEHDPVRLIGGLELTDSTYAFLNPLFNFVFAGVLAAIYLVNRGGKWSSVLWWAPAALFLGLLLVAGSNAWETRHTVGLLVGLTALETFGELWINAVGISLVSRLAPQRFISTTIGGVTLAFWLSSTLSSYLQGDAMSMNGSGRILLWIMCACTVLYTALALTHHRVSREQGPAR